MSRTKSIQFEGLLIKTITLVVAFWLFALISNLFANEATSIENAINQRPTVQADTSDGQQIPAESQGEPLNQDFLSDISPLSKTSETSAQDVISFTEVSGQGKQCSTAGGASQGSESCLIRNENGSFAEVESQWETFGNDAKRQTVTKSYDANGNQTSEETIRVKSEYQLLSDGSRVIEKESIDIVKQPEQGLISRDLIVKNHEKGKVVKTTWAHYVENPNIGALKAALAHHAVLYYDNGRVKAGFANQYKNGKVVEALLNYNPAKNPNLRMELTGVTKWANQIDQLVNQNSVSVR